MTNQVLSCVPSPASRLVRCCAVGQSGPVRHLRPAAWLLAVASAMVVAATAIAAPPTQPVPAPEKAATVLTAVEALLGHLDVSVEHAEYGSLTAPHRLLAETRGAVNRLAATRHDLIGQPWKTVRPLLRRLNRAEEHARALLSRLENWKPRQIPTTPLAPRGTGAITGTVTAAADGMPLAGVRVDVVSYWGDLYATATTDASGTYTAGGLGNNYVYVRTTGTPGFVDLTYDGVPCEPSCSPGYGGTEIAVTDGATVSGIDFALVAAASVSGHVTSTVDGTPVAGVEVSLAIFGSYSWIASATSAADGSFSIPELIPGQYRALASHEQWADEAYDNVPCEPSCDSMAGTPVFLSSGQYFGGIDFALDPTGSISGHVVDAATGNPAYADVRLYNANDVLIWSESSYSGNFSCPDLPPGTYFAVAEYSEWSELYSELPWTTPYDATRGTPIVVTGGQDTPDIDFTMDSPTSQVQAISGQLTDSATAMPLEGDSYVVNALGDYAGYGYSSSTGYYRTGSLAPGTYFVTAHVSSYLDELYDNLPCGPDCNPLDGTPVTVTAAAETTGIDFALDRGGWIAGQVTGADTGLPVTSVTVTVFDSAGEVVSSGSTDETGHYAVFGLPTGAYFVTASPSSYHPEYAGQLYANILCETNCNVTTGTPVAVTTGLPTGDIDFALTPLGSVAGTVTDAATGAPVAGASVQVGRSYGEYSASTDVTGHYRVRGLHSGTVHVMAADGAFRAELYDNIPCGPNYCDMNSGTPVVVTAGNETGTIDFALDRLGTVSGHVTQATDGQPVADESVSIYAADGNQERWVHTNQAGDYSVEGLVTGTYFVRTHVNDLSLVDELYDNIPCKPSCTPTTGTPISVVEGQTTSGIDFALDTGGTISGRITDEQDGTPIQSIMLVAYDSTGEPVAWAGVSNQGIYTLGGLPSGTYYVATHRDEWGDVLYAGELYDNIPCEPSCTVTTGTPVAVTVGAATTGIDFALQHLGGIAGTIVNSTSGQPLDYVGVDIFTSVGSPISNTHSSATGHYSVDYLAPGTYFVKASRDGFRTEVFNDVPCDSTCVVTIGTPVTVTPSATTNGINFALSPRGAISGRLTRDPGGAAIPGAMVNVFDATGSWQLNATSGPDGVYTATDLPAGTYFVLSASDAHHNELYDNIPCDAGCTVTSGTPVTVALGVTTPGVDFALTQKGAISGKVVDQATGAPVLKATELYNVAGNYVSYSDTNPNGTFTFQGLAPGTYFVKTINNYWWGAYEFADELYNNIPCDSGCTITSGTPIVVTDGATTSGIDFALQRHGRITGRVTDAQFGLPTPNRQIFVYDSSGTWVSNPQVDDAGNFSTWYLPAGTYYVLTHSYSDTDPWVDQLWQGHECDPDCTPTLGTPVVVANDTVTTGINFALYKPYFADVPIDFWARPFVHALYRASITSGCGTDPLVYCPTAEVTRAQIAVFLGVAGHGSGFTPPPATGTIFQDVPIDYWSAAWIELLWADGLTTGCATDPLRYCPESPLSRAEMSVFLLGGKHGPDYQPPPATGTVFDDVPITHWAAAWIEELAAEGITSGCAPALFCPDDIVDRAQMAVFLVTTYAIPY